jgi:hypothetical protein
MLLALHDQSGTLLSRQTTDFGVAAAELVELAIAGRVTTDQKGKRVVVASTAPTADRDLDAVLATLASGLPTKLQPWLRTRGRQARNVYLHRLAAAGIVRHDRRRMLGLFPQTRYPLANLAAKAELRWRLDALAAHGGHDHRSVSLAALFSATRLDRLYYPGRQGRQARARFASMASSDWAGVAVSRAIAAMNAAVSAAIVASTAASSAAVSS